MQITGEVKRRVHEAASSVRTIAGGVVPTMKEGMHRLQMHMLSNPGKWAGIAASAGFGLGVAGRILSNRVLSVSPSRP